MEKKKEKEKEEKKKIFRYRIEAFIPSWNDLKNLHHCRGRTLNLLNIHEEPFPLPHHSGIGHLHSKSSVFDNRCFLSCRFRTRSRSVVMRCPFTLHHFVTYCTHCATVKWRRISVGDTCLDSNNENAEHIVFWRYEVPSIVIALQLIPCTVYKVTVTPSVASYLYYTCLLKVHPRTGKGKGKVHPRTGKGKGKGKVHSRTGKGKGKVQHRTGKGKGKVHPRTGKGKGKVHSRTGKGKVHPRTGKGKVHPRTGKGKVHPRTGKGKGKDHPRTGKGKFKGKGKVHLITGKGKVHPRTGKGKGKGKVHPRTGNGKGKVHPRTGKGKGEGKSKGKYKGKVKDTVHPRTDHEGPEGE